MVRNTMRGNKGESCDGLVSSPHPVAVGVTKMHFLGGLEHVGRVLVVLLHFRTGVAHMRSLAAVKETVVETGHRCWNGGRRFGIGWGRRPMGIYRTLRCKFVRERR